MNVNKNVICDETVAKINSSKRKLKEFISVNFNQIIKRMSEKTKTLNNEHKLFKVIMKKSYEVKLRTMKKSKKSVEM
jgi:hypothetical protein